MKLSKLIENLQEVLKENGDKECLFWTDKTAPDTADLVKSSMDGEEWVKYLTNCITHRDPLFVEQSIEATKKDGSKLTYNFIIL